MKIIYILTLFILTSCQMDREIYYSFNKDLKNGYGFDEDDYRLKIRGRGLLLERQDKLRSCKFNQKKIYIEHYQYF